MSESNNDDQELQQTAERAVALAIRAGAKEVRAVAERSRHVTLTYRRGTPDSVEEAKSRGLRVDLYIDGRFTRCRTNDLRDAALKQFVSDAVQMCQAASPDECRALPDPALYDGRDNRDLQLFDPTLDRITSDERHERAAALESATLAAAGKDVVSVEATYVDVLHESHQIQSNGSEGSRQATSFWTWATVTLQDEGEKRPQGWAEGGARLCAELPGSQQVARESVDFARARLGSSKIATGKLTAVVENRASKRLVGYLLRAVAGPALHRKTSFLTDCLGQRIGSDLFTLLDAPFVVGGFGSKLFDSEGISARPRPIVEQGTLSNYYLDTYYARKLDLPPTTGGTSNLTIPAGRKSLDELVAEIEEGVLIRGFIGGNCNLTTGDFSLGVFGTQIERGALTRSVAEVNISGNLRTLWQRLVAVGNDPYPYSAYRLPSLVFDEVQFSGD